MKAPTLMVGGPIRAGFGPAGFDETLRGRVDALCEHLTDAGFELRSAHRAEAWAVLPPDQRATVADRDRQWLLESDGYVAFVPTDDDGQLVPSFGTGVEVGWATILGRPVWLLIDGRHVDRYSPFLTSLPNSSDVQIVITSPGDDQHATLVEQVSNRLAAGGRR